MEKPKNKSLEMISVECCVCDTDGARKSALGAILNIARATISFDAMQCNSCGLVYLNPRPSVGEFETIYPANYHAFDFSEEDFGIVYKIRSRLEAKRVLSWCAVCPTMRGFWMSAAATVFISICCKNTARKLAIGRH